MLIHTSRRTRLGLALGLCIAIAAGAYLLADALTAEGAKPALPSAPDYAATAVLSAPTEQVPAIEDKEVTLEEYEAAVQRTAACLEAAGVEVELRPGSGFQPSQIGFAAGSLTDAEAAKAKLDECRTQYLAEIETTWALQRANPSPAEIRVAHERLTACLVENGAVIEDGYFSVDDLNELALKHEKATDADHALLTLYFKCRTPLSQEMDYVFP